MHCVQIEHWTLKIDDKINVASMKPFWLPHTYSLRKEEGVVLGGSQEGGGFIGRFGYSHIMTYIHHVTSLAVFFKSLLVRVTYGRIIIYII